MVEVPDREVGAQLAQHLRHELQLVVLHPHDAAVGGDLGAASAKRRLTLTYASHQARLYVGAAITSWYSGQMVSFEKPS